MGQFPLLTYTGSTRGKRLAEVVGRRKALAMAVRNNRTEQRFSGLLARLKGADQNAHRAAVHIKADGPCN